MGETGGGRSPNPLIYGEFERLVRIHVLGEAFDVPDGVPLIRAFQYIEFELGRMQCDWSRFCFNDSIGCCAFEFALPGRAPTLGRACCEPVVEGLRVTDLPASSALVAARTRARAK